MLLPTDFVPLQKDNADIGNWEKQQETKREEKEREKLSRETLGKFFYDLAKLAFTAMVLAGAVALISGRSEIRQLILLGCGTIVTSLFAYIGYIILK